MHKNNDDKKVVRKKKHSFFFFIWGGVGFAIYYISIISRNAEMDKARNLRRGAIRFSNPNKRPHMNKQSGRHKLFGVVTAAIRGDLKFSEKSKKEKVRSLSAVGKALSSCQMGCHVSEKEEAHEPSSSGIIATGKRFKFLNGSNGVHHASVPRKLRSAMKKRSRESMLLDSEEVNHKINGIESPKKDGIKKSKKQEISQDWSQREGVSGPITKDEEEVAETLYALAGMFPDNGMNDSKELDGESLPENSSSVLEDLKENANAAFEGTAQKSSPYPERSPRESTKISSIHETIGQEQLDLPERAEFLMASHSTAPIIDLQTMPMPVRSDNSNKGSSDDPELCLAMGLNKSKQSQISYIERKQDVEFERGKNVDCKQEQHMLKEQRGNEGLALWPSSSAVASANKAPNWLEAAICASKQDLMENCSSSGKTSEVVTHKRSWKRCAAHVHISHIIRSLEVAKRGAIEEPELHECHQMRVHEGSKRGVLLELHNLNGMRSGVTSAPGTSQFPTVRNLHESKNDILQQQRHYRDISQAAPTTLGVYGPQNQSFNFLSLSSGSNGLKVDNSYDKIGARLEALSKLQVPYFQSLPQQHGLMSIPTPNSQYASASYLDQLSVPGPQIRLQQPQYYGSPLCGTHYSSSTVSSKQQHQSFWAVQLAAQGRSAANCNVMRTHYSNWQNGRHASAVSPYAQAILPRSPASLEPLVSKITSISGQQQQLITSIQEKWARPSSSFCI